MNKNDFYYDLPKHLIAQQPIEQRDGSRLMVLDRTTGQVAHRMFTDIEEILQPGDCIVINDSKVIPARIIGYRSAEHGSTTKKLNSERGSTTKKLDSEFGSTTKKLDMGNSSITKTLDKEYGSTTKKLDSERSSTTKNLDSEGSAVPIENVEFLLHERLEGNRWTALTKPGRKAQPGDEITFGGGRLMARVQEIVEGGLRVVELIHEGELELLLEEIGEMPLPHYIEEKQTDTARYQTVYAKADDAGASVAAPTAGLHFTDELLERIQKKGVNIARVTLHVGIGTFRPVKEDDITKHHMHSEYCRVSNETAALINETKHNGGRVIAIGTTSCRTLESRVGDNGEIMPGAGKTDIFIYPGYELRAIDGLLTNFHLPESTLIMLVSAIAGRENTLAAYREAVAQEYRFFSYGDAMLIL